MLSKVVFPGAGFSYQERLVFLVNSEINFAVGVSIRHFLQHGGGCQQLSLAPEHVPQSGRASPIPSLAANSIQASG